MARKLTRQTPSGDVPAVVWYVYVNTPVSSSDIPLKEATAVPEESRRRMVGAAEGENSGVVESSALRTSIRRITDVPALNFLIGLVAI